MSAALFSENFYLIRQSTDYFALDIATSPVMHYWSLAVEEQFYFLFPLVFAKLMIWTHFGPRSLYVIAGVIVLAVTYGVVMMGSLIESVLYFSSVFRLYQLMSGVWLVTLRVRVC